MHKMVDLSPTPVSPLEKAYDLAHQAGLKYVKTIMAFAPKNMV